MPEARRVYSTADGDLRRMPEPRGASRPQGDGIVRVSREKTGRGGKVVTVVRGLPGDDAALKTICTDLKRLCGSGGAVKDGDVEIQGDHRERVAARLGEQGHRVKLAGG